MSVNVNLVGKTLVEILNEGYHGCHPIMTCYDWQYLEELHKVEANEVEVAGTYTREDLEETAWCNYEQGADDGMGRPKDLNRINLLEKLLEENNIEFE